MGLVALCYSGASKMVALYCWWVSRGLWGPVLLVGPAGMAGLSTAGWTCGSSDLLCSWQVLQWRWAHQLLVGPRWAQMPAAGRSCRVSRTLCCWLDWWGWQGPLLLVGLLGWQGILMPGERQ